ncbi:hypothetical protein [Flavobacterium sp. WC2430]|uniref:hypothetical protein n=1 Tax=Flavobacterium sp. WC2430 TaxID=3234137 RepID=UPI003466A015
MVSYLCTVKKIALIIIIVLFLKPVFPVIDYIVNYDYISTVLCVNKDKPELHCNGKCQLMKELANAADDEKPISTNKKTNTNTLNDLFVQEVSEYVFMIGNKPVQYILNSKYTNLYSHLEVYSIFHPPIFIS